MIRRVFLRRLVLVTAVLAAGLASGGAAADPVEDIIEEIRAQGFSIVRVQRTWLGRVRIIGQNASFRREVVIDPTTGEIRRDLLIPRNSPEGSAPPAEAPAPELGSSRGIGALEGEAAEGSQPSATNGEAAGESGWGGGWGSQGEPAGSVGEGGGDAR